MLIIEVNENYINKLGFFLKKKIDALCRKRQTLFISTHSITFAKNLIYTSDQLIYLHFGIRQHNNKIVIIF